MLVLSLLFIFAFFMQIRCKALQVALLAAYNNTDITSFVGWRETAGAVGVAWDKIMAERILPQYDSMNLVWRFAECREAASTGAVIEFAQEGVDVLLGPPCSAAALVGGTAAAYLNFPIVLWGPPFTSELLAKNTYPTVMASSNSVYAQAQSVMRILDHFEWHQIGILIHATRSDVLPRCNLLMKDLEAMLQWNPNTTITFRRQSTSKTIESFRGSLRASRESSRFMLLCMEDDEARRNFFLAVSEEGMDLDEYMYMLIESRRSGFLSSAGIPIWMDTKNVTDGRNNEALKVAKKVWVMDNQGLNDSNTFKNDVIAKMKLPPYNCADCTDVNPLRSNVGELGDALMVYAMALNRSHALGIAEPTGTQIADNAQGVFRGYTGQVIINGNGTRDPVYILWTLDSGGTPFTTMRIAENMDNSTQAIEMLVSEAVLWTTRNGNKPLNTPKCGYDGALCPKSFAEQFLGITLGSVGAGLGLVILICLAIAYVVRARRQEEERMNMLWQVPFNSLVKPVGKADGGRSSRSLQSTVTTSTKVTIDSKKETARHAFFLLGPDSVVARKHDKTPATLVLDKNDCAMLRHIRNWDHDNLCKFIGLSSDGPQLMTIWRFCPRGSLKDVVSKGSMNMDWFFKYSLIRDVAEGIFFLHHSIGAHGWISSGTCLIDERWQVKLTYYALDVIKRTEMRKPEELLWTAPEHIRDQTMSPSKEGDIYSFAVVCSEVITKKSAWDIENQEYDVEELIYKLKRGGKSPLRPSLDTDDEHNASMSLLVRDCWSEDPAQRPNSDQIKTLVKSLNHNRSSNLMDHVFNVMEQYATNLEDEVDSRMKELTEEKKKSDVLLYRMLPKQVAEKLKLGQSVEPETFECVTLFFSDVVSFTTLASRCTPLQVVNLLNDLYTTFDAIIDEHDVYKVETIGDGYLCVSGLPHRNGNEHAKEVAEMSMSLLRAIKTFRIPHLPKERINIRVGLHTGSVVTGVVGITMPRYCLFGDAVNTASRMESNGKPGRIHISSETESFLTKVIGGYKTEPRGEVIVKGKGAVMTHWLLTEDDMAED